MLSLLKPSLNWLLVFFPITIFLEFNHAASGSLIFFCASAAIIPLAGWMGHATEKLAERTGEGIGGLLNATFGNAAEFIIALFALQHGMIDVVKASLTGSILGNLLLVMGASFLAGGLRYTSQQFNITAARLQSTMLLLAVTALVLPAVFHHLLDAQMLEHSRLFELEHELSLAIAVVLIVTYLLGLLFSLKTHKDLFRGEIQDQDHAEASWSIKHAVFVLAISTAAVAWMAEILVGSVQGAAQDLGMNAVFVGVIVVAIVGNAAEHSSAVLFALKNRMDLSLGIAIGSSVQIAIFVAPLLVLISYGFGPGPMDLIFSPFEVVAVVLSVLVAQQIAGDGKSNWLEGVQLLSVYLILGLGFYFLPV